MTSRVITVDPFDMVVFGATGDLSARKLLPALYERDQAGQVPDEARVICVSRRATTNADYVAWVRDALAQHVEDLEPRAADRFLSRVVHVTLDATGEAGWSALSDVLGEHPERIRAFYLAVGPDLFGPICDQIGRHGLVTPKARVVVEKPLGKNGEGARAINEAVGRVFEERQIFRIDHYLGKETVQNLMALRFANALFEPLWNAAHIDHVQITVAETLGVEGRAGYYDTSGALRDMVQNHLLQLLCLVAMEPPTSENGNAVRDEKVKVLRALRRIDESNVDLVTVRGQYRAGASAGGAVKGYLDELGNETSTTETFVAIKAEVQNWRWAGVPFYLRTGKRLASRVSEIMVKFRPIPHSIFGGGAGAVRENRLVLRLQPDEGVKLWIMIKDPGPGGMRLEYVPLDMSFASAFGVRSPDAYERLLMDVVRGSQTLFMRRDEVDAAWDWIDPILEAWRQSGSAPKPYQSGTWGPSAAVAMIERDGRTWHDDGE
ncbi:MAG: glucose-6-phosphate dehydrogenase [Alsobacter sp.]